VPGDTRCACAAIDTLAPASPLQGAWRCVLARQQLQREAAALQIQRCFRGHLARQQVRAQQAAAVRIQSSWRSYRAKAQYQQYQSSIVTIQSHWR
jgi:hypothetical protein